MLESQVRAAVAQAQAAAAAAADEYYSRVFNGQDTGACGFASVKTYVKGNTAIARALKKHGFSRSYPAGYELYNPSGMRVQSVDVLYAGAVRAAEILTEQLGAKFYAVSRLD